MADRNTDVVAFQLVFLSQTILHAPAPEQTDMVILEATVHNQRSLGSGSRMNAQVGIVVAVAVLDLHIVTDLKADAIAVIISRGDISNRVTITVLQKDTATIVAIQIGIVFSIPVQGQIFNQDIFCIFAG